MAIMETAQKSQKSKTNNFTSILDQVLKKYNLTIESNPSQLCDYASELSYYAEGDTSDSEPESQISTPQSKNNDLLKKAHSMHYNPFDSQIAEIDSMLAGM
ncbi:22636_t:CDS:2 [Entrophospora sp. SA101]|nr:22636_t:CDS:2 [Entrophospora sp. SA101]